LIPPPDPPTIIWHYGVPQPHQRIRRYRLLPADRHGSFILHGFSAVIVTEREFRVHGDGRVESALAYIPFSQEADLPDEVIAQINNYEPELQCVFAMVDSGGKAAVS